MGAFDGQVAIVTGASAGVGRATALALASEGAAVGLLARRGAPLRAVAGEIEAAGGRTLPLLADLTDEGAVDGAIARAAAELGRIDILVANAGTNRSGAVDGYALADWNLVLGTNLTGVFLPVRAALPHLKVRHEGCLGQVIAVSSGAGRQGYAGLAAYCASKFGLMGFMQALAAEVKEDGIRCATVLPGSVLTDFGGRSAETKRASGGRYLLPEDVAASILHQLKQPPHAWVQELHLWPFA